MSGELTEALSKREQIERDELNRAFREVFTSAAGKRVLFWLLEQTAIYEEAFTGDDNATNYRLGLQSGGRRLIGKPDQIDPRLYPRLLLDIADLKAMDQAAAEKAAQQELPEDE